MTPHDKRFFDMTNSSFEFLILLTYLALVTSSTMDPKSEQSGQRVNTVSNREIGSEDLLPLDEVLAIRDSRAKAMSAKFIMPRIGISVRFSKGGGYRRMAGCGMGCCGGGRRMPRGCG